jgi:hypothetical protein|tara:strand:- start:4470 stop:4913 length:444 start_codon:yes stop_codon:yes gene_type:complete
MYFPEFSPEAKIWIYQSNKPMDASLQTELNQKLKRFVGEWSAHGAKLQAEGEVIDEYRLVLCTDGNIEASGCSIDSSVRFVKELGQNYNLDFFNRLQVLVESDGNKELMHFSKLGENPTKLIFNPAPENLGDFRLKEKLLIAEYLER